MSDKEKSTEELGKEVIAHLLKLGFEDEEIGVILFSSLSEVLWERMTPEQKAEYDNDFEAFRASVLDGMPK